MYVIGIIITTNMPAINPLTLNLSIRYCAKNNEKRALQKYAREIYLLFFNILNPIW